MKKTGGRRNKKHKLDDRYWKLMLRISGNIERVRNAKGLTQEDLESRGFALRWFQRIESGKYSVSLPTLDHLARKLGVDISELFRE